MGKCVWFEQPGKLKLKNGMRNKYLHIQLFITSYIKNKKEQRTHFACSFFEFALSLIANRYFFE